MSRRQPLVLAAALLGGACLVTPVSAADMPSPDRAARAEKRAEVSCRGRECEGPIYITRVGRRCVTRLRREWRDERWQFRPTRICPGDIPSPFLAVGSFSAAVELEDEDLRVRLVTGAGDRTPLRTARKHHGLY